MCSTQRRQDAWTHLFPQHLPRVAGGVRVVLYVALLEWKFQVVIYNRKFVKINRCSPGERLRIRDLEAAAPSLAIAATSLDTV